MTNTDTNPLALFRSSVARLDLHDKLALATFLTGSANPIYGLEISEEDIPFGKDLENAIEAGKQFSESEKVSFAIELLQMYQNEEEEGHTEDEDEEYSEEDYPDTYGVPYD